MSFDEQITHWMRRLAAGDDEAARVVWEQYFDKLVRLARRKLEGVARRAADEEDVALSALKSFCRGAAGRQFPKLDDETDLWRLLVTITTRKACALRRRHMAKQAGGGRVGGESAIQRPGDADDALGGLDQVLGKEPTPELVAIFADDCRRLLDRLGDDLLRRIALLTLEGFETDEIAKQLDCARRTVQRKLRVIRELWSQEPLAM
jgi:DNA-directed RNA polymerase specialized sigma24 family protein